MAAEQPLGFEQRYLATEGGGGIIIANEGDGVALSSRAYSGTVIADRAVQRRAARGRAARRARAVGFRGEVGADQPQRADAPVPRLARRDQGHDRRADAGRPSRRPRA